MTPKKSTFADMRFLLLTLVLFFLASASQANVKQSLRPHSRSKTSQSILFLSALNLELRETPNYQKVSETDMAAIDIYTAGSDSSGGGFFYQDPNKGLMLLDFALYLVEPSEVAAVDLSVNEPIDQFSPHYKVVGFQFANTSYFEDFTFYKLLKSRIELWRRNSPILMSFLEEALKNVSWRMTPYQFKKAGEHSAMIPAVLYSKDKGAWLSIPVFNRLKDLNRAGLFLHEGFRHMKIVYGDLFDENFIFRMTTMIMLTEPTDSESLDKAEFYPDGTSIKALILAQNLIDETNDFFNIHLTEEGRRLALNKNISPSRREKFQKWLDVFQNVPLEESFTHEAFLSTLDEMRNTRYFPQEIAVIQPLFDFILETQEEVAVVVLDMRMLGPSLHNALNSLTKVSDLSTWGSLLAVIDEYERNDTFPSDWPENKTDLLKAKIDELKKHTQDRLQKGDFIAPFL